MSDIARECVLRGVALLDENVPTWYRYVDWDKVDIWDTKWCIIGQLRLRLGTNMYGLTGLYLFNGSGKYGFDLYSGDAVLVTEDEMTEAWKAWAAEVAEERQ